MVRLALSVPYLVLAAIITARHASSSVNERLEQSGQLIAWGSRDLGEFIGSMYPPVPIAIASILPGGAVALSWVGALVAGTALHAMWERMHLRQVSTWLTAVVLLCFALTPSFCFMATEDLSGFIGLGLFAIALGGFLRFAGDGDTEGGFWCGLALGLAVACDPAGVIYALCLGMAAAPVAMHRYRHEANAARASALVIAFPALAALAGWTFLQWRFTGSAFGWLTDDPNVFAFPNGVLSSFGDAFRRVGIGLLLSPLFVVTQALLIRRRREAVLVAVLPLLGSAAALWLGLRVANGHTVVLLGMIAIVSLPKSPVRRVAAVLAAAALVGYVAIAVRLATSSGLIRDWVGRLVA